MNDSQQQQHVWRLVAAGDYECNCGARLYRCIGVHPPAWNAESASGRLIVDGARSLRDAKALAEERADAA